MKLGARCGKDMVGGALGLFLAFPGGLALNGRLRIHVALETGKLFSTLMYKYKPAFLGSQQWNSEIVLACNQLYVSHACLRRVGVKQWCAYMHTVKINITFKSCKKLQSWKVYTLPFKSVVINFYI